MTSAAVGQQTIFGTAVETTYGTPVTVDRFYEITGETLGLATKVVQSNGLRGGIRNMRRGTRRVIANRAGTGDVSLEVATNGFGRLFNQMLGGSPTITAGTGGNTAAFTHVYPMGSLVGKSQTMQKQLLDSSGNVITTLTYPGSKIQDAEFTIGVDKMLELKLTMDEQNEVSTVAPATASYTATRIFYFAEASLSIGGSPVANIEAATLKLSNMLDIARYFLGGAGLKSEPVENDYAQVTGQFTAEVLDETFYSLFKADTAAALSLSFVGGLVPGASTTHESLTIAVPEIHLTGKSPAAGGVGVIKNQIPFEGAYDGTDPGATITYVTADAAA